MSKTVVTTIRLPLDILNVIKERVRMEHIDKTTALREFIYKGAEEWKKEEAVGLFKSGKSLSEAAEFAGVSIREMMELLVENGVRSDMTPEEFEESILIAEELFGLKK